MRRKTVLSKFGRGYQARHFSLKWEWDKTYWYTALVWSSSLLGHCQTALTKHYVTLREKSGCQQTTQKNVNVTSQKSMFYL